MQNPFTEFCSAGVFGAVQIEPSPAAIDAGVKLTDEYRSKLLSSTSSLLAMCFRAHASDLVGSPPVSQRSTATGRPLTPPLWLAYHTHASIPSAVSGEIDAPLSWLMTPTRSGVPVGFFA